MIIGTASFIRDNVRPYAFMNEFAQLFGGYAFELMDGSIFYQSANLIEQREVSLRLDASRTPVMAWDLFGKPGSSVSRVSGELVQLKTELTDITTQVVTNLQPGLAQQFTAQASGDVSVQSWDLSLQDPNEMEVLIGIVRQDRQSITFTVTNIATYTKARETILIKGLVRSQASTQVIATVNRQGEFDYGRQEIRVRPWSADSVPLNTVLASAFYAGADCDHGYGS